MRKLNYDFSWCYIQILTNAEKMLTNNLVVIFLFKYSDIIGVICVDFSENIYFEKNSS